MAKLGNLVRFRSTTSFKRKLNRVARAERLEASELARRVVGDYLDARLRKNPTTKEST
jgi:hypothetical protein